MRRPRQIYLKELLHSPADQFRADTHLIIRDWQNLTEDHFNELKQVFSTPNEPIPLDASALSHKLRCIESYPTAYKTPSFENARSASSTPQALDQEGVVELEREAYRNLSSDGGRPSCSYEILGCIERLDAEAESTLGSYWCGHTYSKTFIMRRQLAFWNEFRDYQDNVRKRYATAKKFGYHARFVQRYRHTKGLQGSVNMTRDRIMQSDADDWKELQYREYRRADILQGNIVQVKKALQLQVACADTKSSAATELKRHEALLRWIDQQVQDVSHRVSPRRRRDSPIERPRLRRSERLAKKSELRNQQTRAQTSEI